MFGKTKNESKNEIPPLPPSAPPGEPMVINEQTSPGDAPAMLSRQAGQSAQQAEQAAPIDPTRGVLENRCTMAVRMQAQRAYMAYCENSGNKNFRGEECPKWEDLPSVTRSHWCASIIAILPHLNAG